ncbi:MAG: BamA/TamA family outer membrane protein [Pyrinomonadaceae bacterium]|nr:BamA/TamA family outer membrane protein [Pyrinomonadaceae bacterium]
MNGREAEGRRRKAEGRRQKAEGRKIFRAVASFFKFSASLRFCILILPSAFCLLLTAQAQSVFEDRRIENVAVVFEGNDRAVSAAQQFELTIRGTLGATYSAVKVRDALDALYKTKRIVSVKVEAVPVNDSGVNLRFIIKRKTEAEKIVINIGNTVGDKVTEQELLLKLNLTNAGSSVTEQTLRDNADLILVYLRERGFFNAEVTYRQAPLKSETEVTVAFQVTPNAQAKVDKFAVNIEGFNAAKVQTKLKLQPGELFSREVLAEDIERIRKALREEKFIAPELEEPRVVFDRDDARNVVGITLNGKVGATVNITVNAGEDEKVGDKKQTELLSVRREGTLDYASIIEGSRRLRNFFQEKGYFFAVVTPYCSIKPEFTSDEAAVFTNNTEVLCSALSGPSLSDRTVDIEYRADLNRKLKLVDIRIQGTTQFTAADIQTVLDSQEANFLGFIPYFGYGRGYTSSEILEQDRTTIESLLRELGYRRNNVAVRQGVSPNGEDLIITFVATEGVPTRISEVQIDGNTSFTDAALQAELPNLVGKNLSRARARNGVRELANIYSRAGFYDAKVSYAVVELGADTATGAELVKLVYTLENEGKKVFVNRILINGNERTESDAILKAINVKTDDVLRSTDIFTSEQNLYATDAFDIVEIKPEPAGERADGNRLSDIIINIKEKKPRLITYGGGFSTDFGANGFFDIRHFNLFGKLLQGGARVRASRLQQLVQIDFINPRFLKDGKNADGSIRFAPLTFSAQYQRDSTVTRFFRSTFDRGTGGIVQRVDENGSPIDEFGGSAGDPTINRLSFSAETSRTISRRQRSFLFARYRFEDVRLRNFESLLVRDLLRPDSRVRISGFGTNFVFDTRRDCSIKYTILDIIAKGDAGDPCRYSATNPTRGFYLTADYNVSLPTLGANIGFHKFQGSFYSFYTASFLRHTTFAGRAILGLASVFSRSRTFSSTQFPDLDDSLPISERFFAGGSTTLRGFEFEQAGPRVVIVPQGFFRNSNGDRVFLNPFTIPFGGNALAIVNLEARIPLSNLLRAVPFYDGGNVFRRVSDIFNPADVPANDVFRQNLRSVWSHTVGLGFRVKTPIGGELGVDYGYLLNPPQFLLPQTNGTNGIFRVRQGQLHFRFSQAF